MNQLPACFFSKEDEQIFDRSVKRFLIFRMERS